MINNNYAVSSVLTLNGSVMLQQRQESNLLVKDWWLQVDWIDFFFLIWCPTVNSCGNSKVTAQVAWWKASNSDLNSQSQTDCRQNN